MTKVNSISFGESVVFDRVDRVDAPDSLLLPEQFDQGEELLDAQEADLEIRREDSSIPCPSLCGVSIGFQGQLICFQNMEISNDPFNKIRSYSDLKKNRRTLPFSKHSLKVQMLPDEDESNGADFDFFNSSEDALNQNQLSSATSGLMLNARSSPCLFIYDISKFLSIDIYLAQNYRLYHEDLEEACLFNRSICQKNGNEDLYRVWELTRLSAALYTRLSTASEKFMPWSHHPLGGRFIIRLIETHIHMGDYATASTILCLFGNILKGNSDWNVLKGVQGAQSYADFLYCHGLLFKRSELLKILRIRSSEDVPKVGSFCERCKQNSQICSICQKNPVICSICRNNVKGMSTFCLKCGHGGHLSHVRDWFSKNELCPSGCGCKCSMSLMN